MTLAPLLAEPLAIQVHAFAALATLALGIIQLAAPKGTPRHRIMGRAWVGLMAIIVITSFAIHGIRLVGPWSPIHLLSIYTTILLPIAVLHARRHRVRRHRATVIGCSLERSSSPASSPCCPAGSCMRSRSVAERPSARGRWQRELEAMLSGATAVFIAAGVLAGAAQADRTEALLQQGAYEVRVRLELPNVVNYAATRTTTICLPHAGANGAPFPVLSANNPLARCPASNLQRDGATLRFDILCEGRGAAGARAVYKIMPGAFEGRIAMVMGGKNMTMTEVQSGRRVGGCDPASAPRG